MLRRRTARAIGSDSIRWGTGSALVAVWISALVAPSRSSFCVWVSHWGRRAIRQKVPHFSGGHSRACLVLSDAAPSFAARRALAARNGPLIMPFSLQRFGSVLRVVALRLLTTAALGRIGRWTRTAVRFPARRLRCSYRSIELSGVGEVPAAEHCSTPIRSSPYARVT